MAQAYAQNGQSGDLERVSRLVLDTEVVRSSSDPRVRLVARRYLIASLAQQRRSDDALTEAAAGYEDAAHHYSPDSSIVLGWLSLQASAYNNVGRFADAEPGLRHVLEERTRAAGPDGPAVAVANNNLAWCLVQQGRPGDAEALGQRSVAVLSRITPEPRELAASLDTLGEIERQLGRPSEAERDYRHAAAINRRFRPQTDLSLATVLDHLSALLRASGRTNDADAVDKEVLAIRSDIADRFQSHQTQ